jgi:hypothetical protein
MTKAIRDVRGFTRRTPSVLAVLRLGQEMPVQSVPLHPLARRRPAYPEALVDRLAATAACRDGGGDALVPSRPDQPLHVRLHQDLEHRLSEAAEEVAVIGLLQRLQKRHPVVGHRVLVAEVKSDNSTLAAHPDGHPRLHRKVHLRGR